MLARDIKSQCSVGLICATFDGRISRQPINSTQCHIPCMLVPVNISIAQQQHSAVSCKGMWQERGLANGEVMNLEAPILGTCLVGGTI